MYFIARLRPVKMRLICSGLVSNSMLYMSDSLWSKFSANWLGSGLKTLGSNGSAKLRPVASVSLERGYADL
jgi:hypothetical protein